MEAEVSDSATVRGWASVGGPPWAGPPVQADGSLTPDLSDDACAACGPARCQ